MPPKDLGLIRAYARERARKYQRECPERLAATKARNYAKRKALGICARCPEPAVVGRVYCAEHLRMEANRARKNRHARYRFTAGEWNARLMACGRRCESCGRSEQAEQKMSSLVPDHDHDTGMIRGVLCGYCNMGIGLLGDTPDGVQRAAEYMTRCSEQLKAVS